MAIAEVDDGAVQEVDLGGPARLDVLQHRRLVVVGDLLAGGKLEQLLRGHVERDPLRVGHGPPLGHDRPGEVARRRLGDAPVREARERADRIRRGVEDQLAPLGSARVRERVRRHAAAGQASASASTFAIGGGLGSNGPMCVSPFVSQPTCPGSTMCPAGKVVPLITS